ncbi:MAG: hypothetical protein IJ611_01230 [Bacteroidales bacterium]|nr:hypothetical protein [Bacteroidales bacterium]
MKVKFTKLAALLLSGAALLAAGCTDYEVDIQKNADAIASANDQIKALQSTIATLETAADHKADVDKLNKAITDLETALNGKIADLTTEVGKKLDKTEFETAKKQLTDALDALSKRVKDIEDANFQAQIDALSEKVDKCATKDELQKAVTDLTTYVDGEIAKLKETVDANAKAIKKINEETIPAINEEIKAIKEKNEAQDETLKLLSDAVEELVALTAGFPDDTTIKEYVDNMEATLKQYVQDELKKYVTLDEFNKVKAQLEGRLDGLDKMLKGFGAEEGSVKTYIDGEILKVNDAIKALKEAHDKDIEALNKVIEQVKADILAVKASIRSLVFVPEVYVDGVEAILVSTLNYNALTLKDADSEDEIAEADTTLSTLTPAVIAKYHVIPSNADLSFLEVGDSVKFVIRENDPFKTIRTRAEATDDFDVVGIYQGRDTVETDVIRVEVKVTGKPATEELISVVALQLTKEDETYTSDYATVFSEDIDDLRIANSKLTEEPAHYRRATEGIATADAEAAIADIPAWTADFDTLSVDHQMAFDEEFDLNEYVVAHFLGEQACNGEDVATFKALGLIWKFELVKNYEVGDSEMFTLSDKGVLTAKDANAINLTPIVRVYLKDGENNVQIAYVKVWVAPSAKDTKITWSLNDPFDVKDQFEFKCEGDTLYADSTVIKAKIQKNGEEVVLKDITWKNFVAAYPEFVDAVDPKVDTMGTVTFENDSLKWVMTPEQLWAVASDPNLKEGEIPVIKHNVAFEAINGEQVVVELVADVKPIKPYRIDTDHYIKNYWDTQLTYARYNVATPNLGETDSTKCVFHNNINAAFIADKNTGVIDLTDIGEPGLEVSNIKYYFCDDMTNITKVGNYDVTFTIEDGTGTRTDVNGIEFSVEGYNTILKAKIDAVEAEIAYICNDADEDPKGKTPNVVVLVKDPDPNHIAKKLLNTDKLYVLLGAKGMICGDDGFEVNLWWQSKPIDEPNGKWEDHFRANYIQPVKVTKRSADDFTDAVDFGQEGSFITLKDLVAPHDWRLDDNFESGYREFGMNPGDQYYNYWEYYGVFDIKVDTLNIKCDLTPNREVPVTLALEPMTKEELINSVKEDAVLRDADGNIVKDADGNDVLVRDYIQSIDDGGFGFLTYRNNGTAVKEFNLFVPVTVQYGWGIITTDEPITVKVNSTIG